MEQRLSIETQRYNMNAFDFENEMNRRKAEAKRAGDEYMKLADFDRPRRRFVPVALLAAIGRLLHLSKDRAPDGREAGQHSVGGRTPGRNSSQQQANLPS